MDSIRSLHIVPNIDRAYGGVATAALGVCQQLAAQGHPVEMVVSRGPADKIDYVAQEYPHVKVHYLPRTFPSRFCGCAELGAWLEANRARFDLVEIHGVFMVMVFQAAAKLHRLGIPYLIRPHGSLNPFDLRKKKWLKRLIGPRFVRTMFERSAGSVSTCDKESDLLVLYGATPAKYVVPLPVPVATQASDADAAAFRRKHGIPADALVVLFLSRIDYKKGLEFLIPALADLKPEFPQLWLVIAGGGKPAFVDGIRGLVQERGLSACTVFPGFVSGVEKQAAFRAAGIFALISLDENFGIVVVEAMQCGTPPVISTGVYIYREIEARGAAVVCETGVASCRAALRRLLEDDRLRQQVGGAAARMAKDVYSPEAATRALLEIYAKVLASPRGVH